MILHLNFCLCEIKLASRGHGGSLLAPRRGGHSPLNETGWRGAAFPVPPFSSLQVGSILAVAWLTWRQNREGTMPSAHRTETLQSIVTTPKCTLNRSLRSRGSQADQCTTLPMASFTVSVSLARSALSVISLSSLMEALFI